MKNYPACKMIIMEALFWQFMAVLYFYQVGEKVAMTNINLQFTLKKEINNYFNNYFNQFSLTAKSL